MIRLLLLLSLCLWPAASQAQGWDWPQEDFSGLNMGLTQRFYDPDKPRLAPDGSVRRPTDPGAPTHFGAFTLLPNGRLCITSGKEDCTVYMRDGQMRMLITESHGRLPFKFELGLGN